MSRQSLADRLALLATVLLTIGTLGCGSSDSSHSAASKDNLYPRSTYKGSYPIKVVCTTGQVADAIRNIGGDRVEVTAMMGPGVDPHLYNAVPSDIESLEAAEMVFYSGLHLEGRLADVLHRLGDRKPAFALTGELESNTDSRLRKPSPESEAYDPHVWHDVKLWSDCVKYAQQVLEKFDPKNESEYRARGEKYLQELAETDTYAREQIQLLPSDKRMLVTAHDAFEYFSTAYGLTSVGLKGISTEDEVDLGRMDEVAKILIDKKIPTVFVESSISPRLVQSLTELCKRSGHNVRVGGELYSDAIGPAGTSGETYTGMIRANVDTIVKGLNGASEQSEPISESTP